MANTATAEVPIATRSRRSAPKSKGGCRPCKQRHSKCDEAKPSCTRCWRAGIVCVYPDRKSKPAGISRPLVPLRSAPVSGNKAHEAVQSSPNAMYERAQEEAAQKINQSAATLPRLQFPGPEKTHLTNYPGSPLEHRSFNYFMSRTAPDLGLFSDDVLWNLVVTRIAFAEKAVRHALVAVAALHEDRFREIDGQEPINKTFALSQYSKAIQALNERLTDDKVSYQTTLLNCLIFGYFEILRGSPDTGLMHLYSGMKLLPSYSKRYNKATPGQAPSATVEPLVDLELARTFARLRIPALVRTPITQQTWNPIREYSVGVHEGQPLSSLREAEDRLRPLVLHAFDPYGIAQNSANSDSELQEEDALRDDVAIQIQNWTIQFERYLLDPAHSHNSEDLKVVRMLRLQSLVAKLWNATGRSSQQVDYDFYIEDFQHILLLVRESLYEAVSRYEITADISTPRRLVEDAPEISSQSTQLAQTPPQSAYDKTISSELVERQGLELIIALYFAATKCRSPGLRRQALDLLQANAEVLPYAGIFSRIMKRVIYFEEQQCLGQVTEDASTWPTEQMRIKKVFFLPLYDLDRKRQTAMFIWQPDGPNTRMRNWTERFSF